MPCSVRAVLITPSHFKTQSVGAHGHDSGYTFDELTIPWQQCVHGVCQNITIAVAQRTPKPVAMRYISLDEHQKAYLLNHQRRPLFFGTAVALAALGVATTALVEVRALKSAFYAFQEKILANLTQIQAQLNTLAENVYKINDGLKRLSANSIISVANAQILTMRTNSRLSVAMLRMTHIPAYLAAATLSAARVMNLKVPVHFGGDLEAFVRDGSNQVVLKKSLENSFYHYLGLILPTQRVTDMLTTLGYLYNPCGHDPFLISDIQEALMPWGSVAYSAIVYAVFPKVDFNPSILLRTCSSIFGQNQNTPNTGCFDTPTSAQSERIRKTTLYQSGSAYAVVVPVDAHDSRDSLTSAYSITDYINVKGESAYENECSSSRFPSAGVASLVYLPLPTRVAVSQSGRQSELGVQCFDPDSFNAQFQGNTLCAPNFIAFPAGVRMDGPPTIGTIPFPEYHGEVDYLSGGTINFKTLAISEATVDVMLLRANVTYFYQTSIGFARTPDFYDEWVTEDGRSVPEELINQYTSWGIATGYTNGSTLQGLVSIPASVYTLPPVGDTRCYSEACARNRLNYEWNGRSYGKALYPIVIADATEPIPCSATFDCSTVGPKARPGSTPTPCGDSQAVCCNAQGYVCFVKFSGTDSLGNMITVGPDGATGFNIKDYLNRTLPGVLPIWDFQERLENATKKLREEMNKTFPVTWTSAESDMGDFFDVVTDGLKAAAEAPLKVANEALDLVKKLNPLGFASDLFGWLLNLLVMLLFAAIAIGVCVCCFKVALDCGGSGRGGITRYFPVGNSDSSASSSLN